jgi:hypothetical protein
VTGLNTIQFPSGLYKSTIKGSSASTTSYTLTLPPDAGSSGQSLTTDGSGTLAWQSAAITSTTNTFSATQNFANIVATGTLTIVSSAVTAIENPTINIGGGQAQAHRLSMTQWIAALNFNGFPARQNGDFLDGNAAPVCLPLFLMPHQQEVCIQERRVKCNCLQLLIN